MNRQNLRLPLAISTLVLTLVFQPLAATVRAASPSPTPPGTPLAPAAGTEVVHYGQGGYRYEAVLSGTNGGFENFGYIDSSWSLGSTPFGSTGTCPLESTVATSWPTGTDLLLRI